MFLFSRKYRQLLGLDITTSSIKLIELAMAGGQYRVESYAAEPTPPNAMNEKTIVDPEAVGEAHPPRRQAFRRQQPRGRHRDQRRCRNHQGHPDAQGPARLPIWRRRSKCRPTSTSPSRWRKSATTSKCWARRRRMPIPSTCCWWPRAPTTSSSGVPRWRRRASTARIVDVEAFALENACRLMTHQMPDGGIDRTIAVVDFGASSTTFSVLRNLKSHLYARFCLRRPAADRGDHAHLRPDDGGGRARARRKAGCRATTRPRCSIRSSTT